MPDPNLNALWCRLIAEELDRAGVAAVVGCPGSRNSPLLFALAAVFGDRLRTAVDERGAGFLALGAAKALGAPVAVCVTSGTAAANLLPAACEAAAAGVPLVLITADRPWEAQGCGAPQTMPQRGLFGVFADVVEIGEPLATDAVLRLLRARVSRAVQAARRPLHLNIPLRDPLPPLPDPAWCQPELSPEAVAGRGTTPFVIGAPASAGTAGGLQSAVGWAIAPSGPTEVDRPGSGKPSPSLGTTPHWGVVTRYAGCPLSPCRLKPALPGGPGLRGLIVAGPDAALAPDLAVLLAAGTGYPVLADATSGLRRPAVPGCVGALDALVGCELQPPELIIRLGGPPLARATFEWLGRQSCPQLVLGGVGDADFLGTACFHAPHPDAESIAALVGHLAPGDASWAAWWAAAELRVQATRVQATTGWNESAVYAAACAVDVPLLWLASSMPVRHANLHLEPQLRAQRILCNRGLAGIDGTVASFLGAAQALGQRGLCLVGDLALFHDLNSLALAGGARGAVVVVNNGGGAIFDALPVAAVAGYRRLVRADHDLDFAYAAAQFRLPYRLCRDHAALASAVAEAAAADALLLIECDLRGGDGIAAHREALSAMRGALNQR